MSQACLKFTPAPYFLTQFNLVFLFGSARPRPASACTEPIHVTLPTGLSPFVSSPYPSPTRLSGRSQCFSPSMQIPIRNSSFSPTPSPSPTRKTFYTRSAPNHQCCTRQLLAIDCPTMHRDHCQKHEHY